MCMAFFYLSGGFSLLLIPANKAVVLSRQLQMKLQRTLEPDKVVENDANQSWTWVTF
jgi:hypothetical protein